MFWLTLAIFNERDVNKKLKVLYLKFITLNKYKRKLNKCSNVLFLKKKIRFGSEQIIRKIEINVDNSTYRHIQTMD